MKGYKVGGVALEIDTMGNDIRGEGAVPFVINIAAS